MSPPRSDPALLQAARKQLLNCLASEHAAAATLGWWAAWSPQRGISRDDLVDLLKSECADMLAAIDP